MGLYGTSLNKCEMHECELLIFFFPLFPFSVLFNKMSLAADIMYDAIKKSLLSWGKRLICKICQAKVETQ